ncbi:P21 protein [Trypanosoma conorhini]|uniref:P21 protein n=1 Tax=Trypanosoma conorhini TaxID=83891 RepID=A0A422PIK9_9TRYP|nr:P21 protein [Trypanosoma conorhini]RNF17555.1 P21 protein [Trypanosoma conorhini]
MRRFLVAVLVVVLLACSVSAVRVEGPPPHGPRFHGRRSGEGRSRLVQGEPRRYAMLSGCRGEMSRVCAYPYDGSAEDWWKCIYANADKLKSAPCREYAKGMMACRNAAMSLCARDGQSPRAQLRCLLSRPEASLPTDCSASSYYKQHLAFFRRHHPSAGEGDALRR